MNEAEVMSIKLHSLSPLELVVSKDRLGEKTAMYIILRYGIYS